MTTRSLPIAALFVALTGSLAASGCGGSSTDPFVGTWKCTGTDATAYTQPPGMMPASEANGSTVIITDDGTGNITRMRMPDNGAPNCTLHAKLDAGNQSFTNTVGETCTTKNGNTITYTSGSAMITSGGYTGTSKWTVTGKNQMGADLAGTGTGTSMCVKM